MREWVALVVERDRLLREEMEQVRAERGHAAAVVWCPYREGPSLVQ